MESAPQPRGPTDEFVLLDVPTLTTLARGSCATRKREPNLRRLTLFSFRAGQQAPPPKLGGEGRSKRRRVVTGDAKGYALCRKDQATGRKGQNFVGHDRKSRVTGVNGM